SDLSQSRPANRDINSKAANINLRNSIPGYKKNNGSQPGTILSRHFRKRQLYQDQSAHSQWKSADEIRSRRLQMLRSRAIWTGNSYVFRKAEKNPKKK